MYPTVVLCRQRSDFPLAMSPPPFDVKLKPGADGFDVGGDACAPVPYASP
jgi:hypothetical protein